MIQDVYWFCVTLFDKKKIYVYILNILKFIYVFAIVDRTIIIFAEFPLLLARVELFTVMRFIYISSAIFDANERSISGHTVNVDFRFSYRLFGIVWLLVRSSWNGAEHRHDIFDRCNSISSVVGLNNNMRKDRLYRHVLCSTVQRFLRYFFSADLSSTAGTSKVESMVLVDHVKIPFWIFAQIFCHFFFPRENVKHFRLREKSIFPFVPACNMIFVHFESRAKCFL